MSAYYFYSPPINNNTNFSYLQNWWTDAACTTRASSLPLDSDDVFIFNQPTFDGNIYTYNSFTVNNNNPSQPLTICNYLTGSNLLTINCTASAAFYNNTSVICNINCPSGNVYFYDTCSFLSYIIITGKAISNTDFIVVPCSITNACFYDNSYNIGNVTNGYFYNNSINVALYISTPYQDIVSDGSGGFTLGDNTTIVSNQLTSNQVVNGYFYDSSYNYSYVNNIYVPSNKTNLSLTYPIVNVELVRDIQYTTKNIIIASNDPLTDGVNSSSVIKIFLDQTRSPIVNNSLNFLDISSQTLTLTGNQILSVSPIGLNNIFNNNQQNFTTVILKDSSTFSFPVTGTVYYYGTTFNQSISPSLTGYFYEQSYNIGTVNTAYISSNNPNPLVYSQGTFVNNVYYSTPQASYQTLSLNGSLSFSSTISGSIFDSNQNLITNLNYYDKSSHALPVVPSTISNINFYNNSFAGGDILSQGVAINFYNSSYNVASLSSANFFNSSINYGSVSSLNLNEFATNGYSGTYTNKIVNKAIPYTGINGTTLML